MERTTVSLALLGVVVAGLLCIILYLVYCYAAAEEALRACAPEPCVCPRQEPAAAIPTAAADVPSIEAIDRVLRVHRLPSPKKGENK